MIDDKDEKASLRPRPPTMIERKNFAAQSVNSSRNLSAPSTSYPYSDRASPVPSAPPSLYGNEPSINHPHFGGAHYAPVPQTPTSGPAYGAIPGAYGVPPPLAPYNGAQYDQAGFGAPPIPGTYGPGAYAPYSADPRYPQYQQNPGYPQYSPYHQHAQARFAQQQQQMFGYAHGAIPPHHIGALPNPSSPPPALAPVPTPAPAPAAPLSEKQQLRLAEFLAESLNSSAGAASSASAHRRQLTQSSGAPPAYEDGGSSAGNTSVTSTSSNGTTVAATPAPKQNARPLSTYTVYDDGDVYGGL